MGARRPAPVDRPAGLPAATARSRAGGPVVVGVDGSPAAVQAVRAAAREAGMRRVGLELVMAAPTLGRRRPDPAGDALRRGFHEVAGLAVQAAARAATAAGVPGLRTRVVDGDPVAVLTAASRTAGLLCVGASRDTLLRSAVAGAGGRTSAAVAGAASCPVLVVAPSTGASVDRSGVVVGVAGTAADAAALAEAFAAAADRSTELVAVHAWSAPGHSAAALEAGRRRGEQLLGDALAPFLGSRPSVPVRRVVLHGRAVATLPGLALAAELVVVGQGPDGLRGPAGPVVSALLREAPCPVLVVPAC